MKKLVLFFATVVAVAFASCGPKAVEGEEVVDSTTIQAPAVDSSAIVVDSTVVVIDSVVEK